MKVRIKLNKANATVTGTKEVSVIDADGVETLTTVDVLDWIPALKAAAMEIQALNAYSGTTDFPLPVTSNPSAMVLVEDAEDPTKGAWDGLITGFIGDANGQPSEDGRLEVEISNYAYLDLDLFPSMPTTFYFSEGHPPTAGKIL